MLFILLELDFVFVEILDIDCVVEIECLNVWFEEKFNELIL